ARPEPMVVAEVVVEDRALVQLVAAQRNPLGKLCLQIGLLRQLDGQEQRRLQGNVAVVYAVAGLAAGHNRLELQRQLHQLAIEQQGLRTDANVRPARSRWVDFGLDRRYGISNQMPARPAPASV